MTEYNRGHFYAVSKKSGPSYFCQLDVDLYSPGFYPPYITDRSSLRNYPCLQGEAERQTTILNSFCFSAQKNPHLQFLLPGNTVTESWEKRESGVILTMAHHSCSPAVYMVGH